MRFAGRRTKVLKQSQKVPKGTSAERAVMTLINLPATETAPSAQSDSLPVPGARPRSTWPPVRDGYRLYAEIFALRLPAS